jgi:hypothetical protein
MGGGEGINSMRQTDDYKKKKIPSNRPVNAFFSKGSKEEYKIKIAIISY